MDAFFASVEQRDHPELKGKPVVVGGSPVDRGVVAAASYEARTYGIRSAMPMVKALQLCPHAVRVPPHFQAYKEASRVVMGLLNEITELVEPLSLDEAYMDVSEQASDYHHAEAIGRRLKKDVFRETQLTASVGIGPNKFIAKVASDYDKPDGFFIIHLEEILDFLAPLPVRVIPGVGERTDQILAFLNIRTIQDLRNCPYEILQQKFGSKTGDRLHHLALGKDSTPVESHRVRKSLSQERTFSHDLKERSVMRVFLQELSEEVAELLEQKNIKGRTIGIKVRFHDFKIETRAVTLDHFTRDLKEIEEVALLLFDRLDLKSRRVRLLGVRVAGLDTEPAHTPVITHSPDQMTFWDETPSDG